MSFPRISSPRIEVVWAGWRSDTYALQSNGWEISAEQSSFDRTIRLALKHPKFNIYGISQTSDYNQYLEMNRNYYGECPPIVIQHMASRMQLNLMDNLSQFNPVDCEPQVNPPNMEVRDIEDFLIFRPINKSKEIIIPESSAIELLDEIIKKQDPKQKEIRNKKRREWIKFTKEINQAEAVYSEKRINDRDDILAQIVCVR